MKTKERILLKALELFNAEGLTEVTLRKIAGALAMSQGNLNYHFKTKGEIVSELYFSLVQRMDYEMNKITQAQPILSFLNKSSLTSMHILYEYRFIIRDLYKVMEVDKKLKTHYLGLQKERKMQYLMLFEKMIAEGLIREEELKGEYERLYERMHILGDNWINVLDFFSKDSSSRVA